MKRVTWPTLREAGFYVVVCAVAFAAGYAITLVGAAVRGLS